MSQITERTKKIWVYDGREFNSQKEAEHMVALEALRKRFREHHISDCRIDPDDFANAITDMKKEVRALLDAGDAWQREILEK